MGDVRRRRLLRVRRRSVAMGAPSLARIVKLEPTGRAGALNRRHGFV
jgi:hypothetical protein